MADLSQEQMLEMARIAGLRIPDEDVEHLEEVRQGQGQSFFRKLDRSVSPPDSIRARGTTVPVP